MLLFSDAISHSVTRNLDLTSFTGPVKAWVRLGEASPQWSLSVGSTFPSQPFHPWWSVVQPFLIVGFKIGLHGQTVDRCVHIMAWCLHCWVPQYLVRAVSKHHHIRKYYLRPPWLGCVLNSGCCLMTASGCQKPQISTKPKLTVVFTGIHWGCIIRIFFFLWRSRLCIHFSSFSVLGWWRGWQRGATVVRFSGGPYVAPEAGD